MQSASSVSSYRTRIADSAASSGASGASAAAGSTTVTAPAPSGSLQTAATPEAAATGRVVAPLPASLSMSSVPSALALRTDAVAPDSSGAARDRKLKRARPDEDSAPPARDLDAKHAVPTEPQTASASASGMSKLETSVRRSQEAMDRFAAHYRGTSETAGTGETHADDRNAVVETLQSFLDVLPRGADSGEWAVKLTLQCTVNCLRGNQIDAGSLRPFWRDICRAASAAGVPLRALAPALQTELQKGPMPPNAVTRSMFNGLVDAIELNHLQGVFDSRDAETSTREDFQSLADLAIRQPLMAVALGELRLRHEPQTRRLGMPIDHLGQCIAERARTASEFALSAVSQQITVRAAVEIRGKAGFDLWRCSLEPYFRGSLANEDKRAPEGVISTAMEFIDGILAMDSMLGIPFSQDAQRLNLDDMSAAFVGWMSEAPRAQREQIHLCLAQALAKMNAPSKGTESAAVKE